MSTMTLEQVRVELRECASSCAAIATKKDVIIRLQRLERLQARLYAMADAIDTHLAQPVQAVDVDTVREVIAEMEIKAPRVMLKHVDSWAERLTRALSGEKAGSVDGWQPIETAPDDCGLVLVYAPDKGDGECIDFDYRVDGVWEQHADARAHYMAVGGPNAAGPDMVCTGPGEQAPYTHWARIPASPAPDKEGNSTTHGEDHGS